MGGENMALEFKHSWYGPARYDNNNAASTWEGTANFTTPTGLTTYRNLVARCMVFPIGSFFFEVFWLAGPTDVLEDVATDTFDSDWYKKFNPFIRCRHKQWCWANSTNQQEPYIFDLACPTDIKIDTEDCIALVIKTYNSEGAAKDVVFCYYYEYDWHLHE